MSYIDIAIVIPLLYATVKGFSNGLIKEITGLLGFFLGIYFAVNFSFYLEPKISKYFLEYEKFIPIITFLTLFIITIIAIRFIGYILDRITKALALGFISKLLGAVFGFLKVLIIFCFLLFIVKDYKLLDIEKTENTVLLEPLEQISKQVIPKINEHKDDVLEKIEKTTNQAKQKINSQPK